MQQSDADRPRTVSRRGVAVLAATAFLALGVVVALVTWRLAYRKKDPPDFELVVKPVVQLPITVPADAAALPDGAVVIGVEAGGQQRAYLLEALYRPGSHVINDVVGGKPITVTYCDMTDCVAVYTAPNSDKPLDIAVGGWQGHMVHGKPQGSMLLRVGWFWYRQDNGQPPANLGDPPFPYVKTGFTRTTWKEWSGEHKDTDVYVGDVKVEAD